MKTLILILSVLVGLTGKLIAQVTRQESTNQLRKVVYSGNPAQCPQLVLRGYDYGDGSYFDFNYAVFSIPELTLANMPVVSTFAYSVPRSGGRPEGWVQAEDWFAYLSEGACRLYWKETGVAWQNIGTNRFLVPYERVYLTAFKTVVTYETGINLSAQNTGTGKSLELNLRADPQTAQKVRGYKVYRREREERK